MTEKPPYGSAWPERGTYEYPPSAETINALPERLRRWISELETQADPAATVRDAAVQRENAEALSARVKELEARSAAEKRVLDAARKFLESWEDHDAFPGQEELPEEYELCVAAADLRALWVDAELEIRGEVPVAGHRGGAEDMAARVRELENDVRSAHHAHANALNAKQQRIVELESQLQALDARVTELEQAGAALQTRIVQLNESNDCFMQSSEIANAEADRSKARIRQLETRIAEALDILATPGTWSEFAARARKALTDG